MKVGVIVSMQCRRGCIRRLSLLHLGHLFAQGNLLRLGVNDVSDEVEGI